MQFKIISALAFITLVAATNGPSGPTILPPFPGNPLPTIRESNCGAGQFECCKFLLLGHLDRYAMMNTIHYRQGRPGTYWTQCLQRPR